MRFLLSFAVALFIHDKLDAQPKELREPCERLVIKISEPSRVLKTSTPIGPAPEVELRTCSSGEMQTIQIAIIGAKVEQRRAFFWKGDAGIGRIFKIRELLVVETIGASRNTVYVFKFDRLGVALQYEKAYKGAITVAERKDGVELSVSGIWRGDAEEVKEVLLFKTVEQ